MPKNASQPIPPFTAGHRQIGATLRQLVDGCERAVPGQILGYYVTGSHADGTDLATSDLDLIIVTRTEDESSFQAIAGALEQVENEAPIEVDPTVVPLTQFQHCHVLYRKHIGDEWSSLLEDIYDLCRTEWGYLIPEETDARARLRTICRRGLQLENHFLSIYKPFLIQELRRDPAPSNRAVWLMNEIPFDDDEVLRARLFR